MFRITMPVDFRSDGLRDWDGAQPFSGSNWNTASDWLLVGGMTSHLCRSTNRNSFLRSPLQDVYFRKRALNNIPRVRFESTDRWDPHNSTTLKWIVVIAFHRSILRVWRDWLLLFVCFVLFLANASILQFESGQLRTCGGGRHPLGHAAGSHRNAVPRFVHPRRPGEPPSPVLFCFFLSQWPALVGELLPGFTGFFWSRGGLECARFSAADH